MEPTGGGAGALLRWTADAALRREYADGSPRPGFGDVLLGTDGFGWRSAVHREDLPEYEGALHRIVGTTGRCMVDYRIVVGLDKHLHLREELTGHLVGPVAISGMALDVSDLMDDLETERTRLSNTRALEALAADLGGDTTLEELAASLATHASRLLGTVNVAVLVVSETRHDLLVYQGPQPARGTTALRVVDFTGDTPAGLAAQTGSEAFYTSPEDIATSFPKLAQRMAGDLILGAAALPLGDAEEPLGAIWYRWPDRLDFDDELVDLLRRTTATFGAAFARLTESTEQQARLIELTHTNRELESMTAVAAHDLKAPLRRVHSFVQLLEEELRGADVSDDAAAYAEIIRSQVREMDLLIEDLLQYSTASRPDIEQVAVDLASLLDDVRVTLEPIISAEGATFEIGSLPVLKGDRNLLLQLFTNLIENAVKYRHPDRAPVVTISATCTPDDERRPEWHVTVADNGVGIALELHAKVFQLFERGHIGDSHGTGIGLAIVKRVVERHGGTVWLDSELNSGSTFHLTLPGVPSKQAI